MINYEVRKWGFGSLTHFKGSVFPKAFAVALPSALLAMLIHHAVHDWGFRLAEGDDVTAGVIGGYTFILGFLINTRASRAYSRWWEGGTLLQQLRGEWFNAFSSLLAFCSTEPDKREDVERFQQLLVRLMSLLYCSGLQQVSTMPAVPADAFEIIETEGMDADGLAFLDEVNDKVEVVLQWIQRLVVENIKNGVLPIAPPILSRVFQEYSRGIVNLNNARKIADFPFPFPLVQCISFMLGMHWLLIPITCGSSLKSMAWSGLLTFVVVFSFWCIHFFSFELEMPFGRSTNHLPLQDMQADMNRSLTTLLKKRAQFPPKFECPQNISQPPGGKMEMEAVKTVCSGSPKGSNGQAKAHEQAPRPKCSAGPLRIPIGAATEPETHGTPASTGFQKGTSPFSEGGCWEVIGGCSFLPGGRQSGRRSRSSLPLVSQSVSSPFGSAGASSRSTTTTVASEDLPQESRSSGTGDSPARTKHRCLGQRTSVVSSNKELRLTQPGIRHPATSSTSAPEQRAEGNGSDGAARGNVGVHQDSDPRPRRGNGTSLTAGDAQPGGGRSSLGIALDARSALDAQWRAPGEGGGHPAVGNRL